MRHHPTAVLLILLVALCQTPVAAIEPIPTYYPAAERIVAIGDLHGDLQATREVFRMAGVTDEQDRWTAGDLVVVQTGDQLDRGDDEQAILEFLEQLQGEARAAGGILHILNGNHELMNARLDLRYVTPGGFQDFEDAVSIQDPDSLLMAYPPEQRARIAAFRPGGPYARILAQRNLIIVIGDNAFAHGGILPAHLEQGLEELNLSVRRWLAAEGPEPENIHNKKSPTWSRDFSDEPDGDDCSRLARVLAGIGAKRLVVGHTIQDGGITAHCEAQVWCIDTGMARHYGGPIAALEIMGDEIRILMPEN